MCAASSRSIIPEASKKEIDETTITNLTTSRIKTGSLNNLPPI